MIYATAHVPTVLKIAKKPLLINKYKTLKLSGRSNRVFCFPLCGNIRWGSASLTRIIIWKILLLSNVLLCYMYKVFALCASHQEIASLEMVKYRFWLDGTPRVQITWSRLTLSHKQEREEEIYQRICSILCTFLCNFLITFANTNFVFNYITVCNLIQLTPFYILALHYTSFFFILRI